MKTTQDFRKMKEDNDPIVMITAYDAPSASLAEEAGADVLLVGDSLGMVVLGYDSTVQVTVEDMIYHTKAVKRGTDSIFTVTDIPFMAAHISTEHALKASADVMQKSGADAVKIEGSGPVIDIINRLTEGGVPVVSHLGLTPQTVGVEGGYRVQGKTEESKKKLLEDAAAVEKAGACMLVLECVPEETARLVQEELTIPVIGIGAGRFTDGQVLVYHDIIGYYGGHTPKFVKQYTDIRPVIHDALSAFKEDVKEKRFPEEAHVFKPYGEKK
ncbi:3-methyl-2-oxobutanoate hydroxymethyltransferase [Alkalicoccus urumqiensis]|uniref:3-methyl-2-oxobutanoate hydroxymethyltransferase n=1 Tax=Alkalicoccus urumqiensis TaxID=1548213 RepID=A0A2P6MKM4_ALKUR|nr:3-methyl-2-oxobutanoate hydroxymethyltransferase [Alkalicoccus urumqiensis]PRO66840.1 3-methyl-2-oxobutanoate hydroxymethyltransferase [Alkalicoccus urumqiensis]